MEDKSNLDQRLQRSVQHFWSTRDFQSQRAVKDQGFRSAVTGGKQMDGFIEIVRDVVVECGISDSEIHYKSRLELPGYFRPEKKWDILVIAEKTLVVAAEFKSQSSSFGNNFNNRVEEAVGSATDLWTAYREGGIPLTPRPWLGYFVILVDSPQSQRPVAVNQPHFKVFEEFNGASYVDRYRILLSKLMRERLYDATSFILTPTSGAGSGVYSEPNLDLSFKYFIESLRMHTLTFQKMR